MPFNFVKKLHVIDEVDIGVVVAEDRDHRKINGARQCYRTDLGLPWVLPIVREVETLMAKDIQARKEDISCFGTKSFRNAVTNMVLGEDSWRTANGEVSGAGMVLTVQSVSNIGALRLIGEIAYKLLKYRQIYLPDSSWELLQAPFVASGFPKPKTYRYYDRNKHELDMEGLLEDLYAIPSESVVFFYTCCHNPTGCDPTPKQWKSIADAIGVKLFPVMDLSYQGMASGDPDTDAYPIRLFARLGIEMAVSVAFSHNFLLYNERVGATMFIVQHTEDIVPLKSHLAALITSMYGNPPYYGAKVVATILKTPALYRRWIRYLDKIRSQILNARKNFVFALQKFGVPGNWDYISKGTGMNTSTNLTDRQVQHLILYHHVYIRTDASLSVGTLTDDKIEYVAEAMADCIKEYPNIEDSDK